MGAIATNGSTFNRIRGQYRFAGESTSGDIYFVNSAATTGAVTPGLCSDTPATTLIAAMALCAANHGDIVYAQPGHAETIAGAAGMTFSTNGVTYRGLGTGRSRPTITFSTNVLAQMIVSGNNVRFENMVFDFTGINNITTAISITGADVSFDNCEFSCQNSTIGVAIGILTGATASRFTLTNCRFLGVKTTTGATATAYVQHDNGEDFVIRGCHMVGKATQLINNTATVLNGKIENCTLHAFTGTKVINAAAASQFEVLNNNCIVASGTAPVVGTALNALNNTYTTESIGVVAGTAKTF